MTGLRVSNLSVAFGQAFAIQDLSFEVELGDSLVLLGPNGAGKTSAVEAIAGLLPKRGGKVEFFGDDISRLDASRIVRRGLALVPQWRELFPNFTVQETLLTATNAAAGRAPMPFDQIYDLFPVLRERRQQLAGSLSGGEQQMLAIGRALVTNPRMILLDEPSAGLAVGIVRNLIEVVHRIRAAGVAVLLVEQNTEIARSLAQRCCILAAGRAVWQGPIQEALDRDIAAHAYFGSRPA